MTLKQSQSHQTDDENLDPEQGYNRAKFERSRLNSVQEKGSVKVVVFSNEEICQLSPLNMCENQKR